MVPYLGDIAEDATIRIVFNTFTSDNPAASVTVTDLADADIKVHKDGNATPITTDGATVVINFATTGSHQVTIDTSADADYAVGSDYYVRLEGITVDAATLNVFVGHFSIENRFREVNATQLGGQAITAGGAITINAVVGAATVAATKSEMDTAHGLLSTTADVLDKLGAVDEAAAAGDPSATESVIQYVKQIVNVLEGADGITSIKAAAAPASGVSLSEMIVAIYNVMKVDTLAEISQTLPPATPTVEEYRRYMYNALRNRLEVDKTALFKEYFNDTGTLCWKKVISDDGTTYIEQKAITGA